MGIVNNLQVQYEETIDILNKFNNSLEEIIQRSAIKTNPNIEGIRQTINKINDYILTKDALNIDKKLASELCSTLPQYTNLIMSEREITNDNFINTYNALNNIYLKYMQIFNLFEIESKINELEKKYQSKINDLSNELNKSRRFITHLTPEAKRVEEQLNSLKIKTKRIERAINERTFEENTEILSKKFFEKRNEIKNRINYYNFPAILLTMLLGIMYIGFFIYQLHLNTDCTKITINPINHLMLIASCSPIIFLIIWLFYQGSRLTNLAENYSFKSNLGYTLKEAVNFTHDIENRDKSEETLILLKELITKLYEIPFNNKVKKNIMNTDITELTNIIKEVKSVVDSIKSSK